MSLILGTKVHQCVLCGVRVDTEANYNKHFYRNHAVYGPDRQCHQCAQFFVDSKTLRAHKTDHCPGRPRMYSSASGSLFYVDGNNDMARHPLYPALPYNRFVGVGGEENFRVEVPYHAVVIRYERHELPLRYRDRSLYYERVFSPPTPPMPRGIEIVVVSVDPSGRAEMDAIYNGFVQPGPIQPDNPPHREMLRENDQRVDMQRDNIQGEMQRENIQGEMPRENDQRVEMQRDNAQGEEMQIDLPRDAMHMDMLRDDISRGDVPSSMSSVSNRSDDVSSDDVSSDSSADFASTFSGSEIGVASTSRQACRTESVLVKKENSPSGACVYSILCIILGKLIYI